MPSTIRRSGQLSGRPIKSGRLQPDVPQPARDLDALASRYFTWRQLFHVGETFSALQGSGGAPVNVPQEAASWDAVSALAQQLLDPLHEQFGELQITYGFASPELAQEIRRHAKLRGTTPRIDPALDQHAAAEIRKNRLVCERGGAAVDVLVPSVSSSTLVDWIERSLPFDRMYLYGDSRPLHLSYSPNPTRLIVEMREGPSGRLIPRVRR